MHIAEQLKLFDPINLKPQRGTPETDFIKAFMIEINKERPPGSFYIKNGKKVPLRPMTFIGVLMKLKKYKDDRDKLDWLFKECLRNRQIGKMEHDFNKTFSTRFFGEFREHEWQKTL